MSERFNKFAAHRHGATVHDDLSIELDQQERQELRELFLRHGLLHFPNQTLSMDRQIEILGCIESVLHARDGVGYIATDAAVGELGRGELIFHSDLDFTPCPYKVISLLALDVEAGRTLTRFANNRAACEQLPADLAARLFPMTLTTALPDDYGRPAAGMETRADRPHFSRSPIVRHWGTDALLLMVSQQAVRFEDCQADESCALLQDLHDRIYAPDNVHEHFWRDGDFVIWDNWVFQHARGAIAHEGARTLQRVVVAEHSFFEFASLED